MKTLEEYTKKVIAIRSFKEKNANIFHALEVLENEKEAIAAELRAEAIELLKNKIRINENRFILVRCDQPIKKFYDIEIVEKLATPAQMKFILSAIKREIITKDFEVLVSKGIVPIQMERKAYKEVKLSPRVTITEKSNEEE